MKAERRYFLRKDIERRKEEWTKIGIEGSKGV